MLVGERQTFVDLAHETGKVEDWQQIIKWSAAAFSGPLEPLVNEAEAEDAEEQEAGEPGTMGFSKVRDGNKTTSVGDIQVNGNKWSSVDEVRAFQLAYNANRGPLGDTDEISVD